MEGGDVTPSVALLVTLVVYKVILITIGILSQSRVQDGADYFWRDESSAL